jgi:hypothetical protein
MAINDILQKLNEINHEDSIKILIPSLGRTVAFKPLSLQQQKDILKAGISSEIFNILEFNAIFNNIIEQNSLERNNYSLHDRSTIAIALRNKFTTHPLEIDDKNIDTNIFNDKNINFDNDAFNEFSIEEGILKIIARSPSLQEDQTITKLQLSKIKKTNNIDITNVIGEMYVFEILKYIKSLHVGEVKQDLISLSIEDRIKVVEQIPASIITKLNDLIAEKFKKPEDDYLTVDDKKITLDARLFV